MSFEIGSMIIVYLILLVILIIIIFLFSSPKLSPIPYFPSQSVDISKIIKALDLKNNQIIFDLGAGDGIVIFKAAEKAFRHKFNTKFVAVEINPILILILHLRRLFHINRNNIKIVRDDIFKINIKDQISKIKMTDQKLKIKNDIIVYLYISPWFLEKTIENCKMKNEKFSVVSYMYPIKSLKKKEIVIQGRNKIFSYL
ncbi:MAG: rRNA adenine N-6-methyltransferase family protein [Nanoarchaeota archaeon]|nr:rRNA adenine N-6-methyltransferase family protein [Nanoarchaeota archaeon]